uniref:Uncharacterized protein n=1 Tax=Hyaloperonospora arabidopsidis (strain Emoy2) TaxID=559515 RepID=M4BVX3_HYAAE
MMRPALVPARGIAITDCSCSSVLHNHVETLCCPQVISEHNQPLACFLLTSLLCDRGREGAASGAAGSHHLTKRR